jgi:hypothetical protein
MFVVLVPWKYPIRKVQPHKHAAGKALYQGNGTDSGVWRDAATALDKIIHAADAESGGQRELVLADASGLEEFE